MTERICHHVNLQLGFGGGEVYTRFLLRALCKLGWSTRLYTDPSNHHWAESLPSEVELVPLKEIEALARALPETPTTVFFHTPPPQTVIDRLHQSGHRCCVFVHMPLFGRDPAQLMRFDYMVAVSQYVITGLRAAGITNYYPIAMLGVADLDRGDIKNKRIVRGPLYDWDRRKVRERLGRLLTPLVAPFLPHRQFSRRPGLSLGIVSRLTPIKQFPLLFSLLAPILAQEHDVNLEIFGSGGYATVRDLKLALRPLGERCRFWGHQDDVRSVYGQLDALMTGLPEKEALGLNVIEAEACGLPVIAVDAPPFDETVSDGITGWRYTDPRQDGGKDFQKILNKLRAGLHADPHEVALHLECFSFEAFVGRVDQLMNTISALPELPHAPSNHYH